MSTIREVAKEAGVSVTTVSRTINNRGYISEEMRMRIQKAMDALDYHPNEVARSLSFQRTRMIGVLLPEIRNPFFGEIVTYISRLLTRHRYKMLLYIASGTADKAHDYVNMLKSNQVDGIITALRGGLIEEELGNGLPVVSLGGFDTKKLTTVVCDNLEGGRLAGEELLACGSAHPLMVSGWYGQEENPAADRIRGYREAVGSAGVEPRVYGINVENNYGEYSEVARDVFRLYPDADGFFCSSDSIASYIMQEALRLGRRIPEDVRVVGFNDSAIARRCIIPMTSIHQPIQEMCSQAFESLRQQIHHQMPEPHMVLPVTISRRASTRGYAKEE